MSEGIDIYNPIELNYLKKTRKLNKMNLIGVLFLVILVIFDEYIYYSGLLLNSDAKEIFLGFSLVDLILIFLNVSVIVLVLIILGSYNVLSSREVSELDYHYKLITKSIDEVVFIISTTGKILYSNGKFSNLFSNNDNHFQLSNIENNLQFEMETNTFCTLSEFIYNCKESPKTTYNTKIRFKSEERNVSVVVNRTKLIEKNSYLLMISDLEPIIKTNLDLSKYKRLFNMSKDFLCIANTEGYFELINPTFSSELGYSNEELMSKTFLEFVHPEDIEPTMREVEKLSRGETTINFVNRYRKSDGDYIWLRWKTVPVDGTLFAIARDITQIKEQEDLMLAKLIVNSLEDPILLFDENLRVKYANSEFYDFFNTDENIDSMTFGDLMKNSKNIEFVQFEREIKQKVVEGNKEIKNREISIALEGLGEKSLLISVKKLQNEKFYPNFILLIVHDITEQKSQTEELVKTKNQLAQAQKMEAIGRLAGGVAHDFNNLLSIILGYSSHLLNLINHGRHHDELLEIYQAGERAKDLTKQLLIFSRKKSYNLSVINLSEQILEMKNMINMLIREDVIIEYPKFNESHVVKIDLGHFEQILINLLVNASDAMPNGGNIVINTKTIEFKDASVLSEIPPGTYVRLSVSDSGIGMSKEIQSRIFEPFFTTKSENQGTGLGLSVVYGLVKQNQGYIHCYSEIGVGTSFNIYFPTSSENAFNTRLTKNWKRNISTNMGTASIMVIEDEPAILKLIEISLHSAGHQVFSFSNGSEALKFLMEGNSKIDVIITDIIMPDFNGIQILQTLRTQLQSDIPVILMSGYNEEVLEKYISNSSHEYFVEKPINTPELLELIEDLISH